MHVLTMSDRIHTDLLYAGTEQECCSAFSAHLQRRLLRSAVMLLSKTMSCTADNQLNDYHLCGRTLRMFNLSVTKGFTLMAIAPLVCTFSILKGHVPLGSNLCGRHVSFNTSLLG